MEEPKCRVSVAATSDIQTAAGLVLRVPSPPPPQDDTQEPRVSRYRTLRGESIPSCRNHKAFDAYDDGKMQHNGSDASPARGQSNSESQASIRSNAAERNATSRQCTAAAAQRPLLSTSKSPLIPQRVNFSSPDACKFINLQGFKTSAGVERPTTSERPDNLLHLETEEQARKRIDREEAARWADEAARLEAKTDRILAEQKKRNLDRLHAQLATASSPKTKPKRPIRDKLTFFHSPKPKASYYPTTPKSAPAEILAFTRSPATESSMPSPENMSMIELSAKGTAPQTDTPTPASNGAERRVEVRCLSSTINLPVTKETNPVDISYSTANHVTHKIVPADCIMVEYYEVLGIERRLRNYERICDVMNSWDSDQQNTLLLTALGTNNHDLDLSNVPRTDEPPTGFTFLLYHSSRPGKWTKRYVTLMDSGHMFAAKRLDSKSTDKNSTVLCHLSDSDIYTPRQNQLRRHLKPPKTFCYAIKSQQKTTLFPNGDNFVHFFSADDNQLAHRFYELIYGWRSWYLANKKVAIMPEELSLSVRRAGIKIKKSPSISRPSTRHQSSQVEEASYTIGDMQPLIDMKQFDKPLEEFGKNLTTDKKSSEPRALRGSNSKVLSKDSTKPPTLPMLRCESEFLADGQLGATYNGRKVVESVTEDRKTEGPLSEGSLPTSLPTSHLERPSPQSWFPSATEHSSRSRIQSRQRTANAARTECHPSATNAHPPMPLPTPGQRRCGRRMKAPAGASRINLARGGAADTQRRMPLPRSSSKASLASGMPHNRRPRTRSRATPRVGGQRPAINNQPSAAPLPVRSARRLERVPIEPMLSREQRPEKPLNN